MSCLKAGDHLLMTDSVYLPTRHFCNGVLKKFGVETTYYDPQIGAGIEALIRPNTTAVFTEAPGSQSFEMQDIPAIAEVAHRHGAVVLMDNTWATPLLFPPHERGVDIAIEAGTKYLSGGSDLLLGMVSANERCFKALRDTYDAFAMCPGPEDVFLGLRGLRTMALRLREHEKQALDDGALARSAGRRWPGCCTRRSRAIPATPSGSATSRARRACSRSSSSPAPTRRSRPCSTASALFGMGYSWGGFESLVIPFDCATYRTATQWEPGGHALRFHIGLEDLDDLKRDLDAGFARLRETDTRGSLTESTLRRSLIPPKLRPPSRRRRRLPPSSSPWRSASGCGHR